MAACRIADPLTSWSRSCTARPGLIDGYNAAVTARREGAYEISSRSIDPPVRAACSRRIGLATGCSSRCSPFRCRRGGPDRRDDRRRRAGSAALAGHAAACMSPPLTSRRRPDITLDRARPDSSSCRPTWAPMSSASMNRAEKLQEKRQSDSRYRARREGDRVGATMGFLRGHDEPHCTR